MPSTETSLMMTASSVASQSELGDMKSEYRLKRLNRSSPLSTNLSVMCQSDGPHDFIYCDFFHRNTGQGVQLISQSIFLPI